MKLRHDPVSPYPLGASLRDGGANFSLFSKSATGVELLFFDHADDANPSRVVALDPASNRTYYYWHALVPGVAAGQLYAYRVHGPNEPERGLRFDSGKVLLDPYGRAIVTLSGYRRAATLCRPPRR